MPYHLITPDEVRSLLDSDPPHTGKLATARADGRPHSESGAANRLAPAARTSPGRL